MINKVMQPPSKHLKDGKTPKHNIKSADLDKILTDLSIPKTEYIQYSISPDKYDLLQLEILGSVSLENGEITNPTKPYINENSEAVSKETIISNYFRYIGRAVYKEHIETPTKPYGFVIDSRCLVKPLTKDDATLTIQLLVAITKEVSREIQRGEWKFSSFGIYGETVEIGDVSVITTESDYVEASLVKSPAYGGATLSILYLLNGSEDITFRVPEISLIPIGDKEVDDHIVIDKMATRIS